MRTPVFYAEGLPGSMKREDYTLRIKWDDGTQTVSFSEIEAMPLVTVNARLTSVSGFSVRADWQGVRWPDFARLCNIPRFPFVEFKSWSFYTSCLSWEELEYEKVLLCYKVGGEYLEKEYGAPLRLFVPHRWGYKSVKGLAEIQLLEKYRSGYWEERGYSDSAYIEPGTTYDVNSGSYKPMNGGEVTEF